MKKAIKCLVFSLLILFVFSLNVKSAFVGGGLYVNSYKILFLVK